jgi:hypothetical protein
LYQELLRGVGSYQQLGNRLIRLGEQAHAFRQFDKVKEVGLILSNIPIKAYQSIGYYFLAVAANHNGNGDQEKARKLFELVADKAPSRYRAKAIMSLAAVSANTGDYDSELYYFYESLKAGETDIYTFLKAHKGIAVIRAREGFHNQSLSYLESFLPMLKFADPIVYYDYLNSLAVELGEVGRRNEARNIMRHVIASPLAIAYPEWRGTADDLRAPNRSFAFIDSTLRRPLNVLYMPAFERDSAELPAWAGELAKVVGYEEWKRRMAKKKKNGDKLKPEEFDERKMLMRIMDIYMSDATTDEQRLKMWEAAERIAAEPNKPDTPDDNDKSGA